MSTPLLTFLKYIFLAVLYLFFLRVLRAVWVETRDPKVVAAPERAPQATGNYSPTVSAPLPSAAPAPLPAPAAPALGGDAGGPGQLVVLAGAELDLGRVYSLPAEVSVGRSPGCGVSLADDFVSQVHARLFRRDGAVWVEDLGSTNGTFVNDTRVTGPLRLSPGDRLRVGRTELQLELEQAAGAAPAWERR